jgi:DNA modification methylase
MTPTAQRTETVIHGDSFKVLPTLASDSFDFVCTSPPYDDMRKYNGFPLISPEKRIELGRELYRVLKPGSICSFVVSDGTTDAAESLTSFEWALNFTRLCGFKLFETIIYVRERTPGKRLGFATEHEYVFNFLKGDRPRVINKEHLQVVNATYGKKWKKQRRINDKWNYDGGKLFGVPETKDRGTVWYYAASCTEGNRLKLQHTATMPDALASDLLRCFTNEGDTVLDCFAGSGTTLVEAAKWKRGFVGIEYSAEYVGICQQRIKNERGGNIFDE